MAIKAVVENLEELDEGIRGLYRQAKDKAGKPIESFVLDLTDLDGHPDVASLKASHAKLRIDNKALADKVVALEAAATEMPEGFTAEEWQRLKALETAGGTPDERQKEALDALKRMHDERLKNVTATKDRDIIKLQGELDKANLRNKNLTVDTELEKLMDGAMIAAEHRELVRAFMKPKARVKEEGDKLVIVADNDLETPYPDYFDAWSKSDQGRRYVKPAEGGGAPGSRTTGKVVNPFKKGEGYSLDEQTKLFRDNPAKARQMAKEAGVTI